MYKISQLLRKYIRLYNNPSTSTANAWFEGKLERNNSDVMTQPRQHAKQCVLLYTNVMQFVGVVQLL